MFFYHEAWPIELVLKYIRLWNDEFNNKSHTILNSAEPRVVRWYPPINNSVKLNVDGSCYTSTGFYGAGGLIRDCDGNHIVDFSANVGKVGVIGAELFAIRQGLMICSELGFNSVCCESDSMEPVHLCLLPSIPPHHRFAALIADIHHLLRQRWNCNLSHILREGNACADQLSKFGVNQEDSIIRWHSPPSFLNSALLADAFGVSFLRPP